MGKRAHGEGTITQRADGTWMGQISLGYDDQGKRKRKTVYGKTQKEVREKLDEIKRQVATSTYSDTKFTVSAYLQDWLRGKERELAPKTCEGYHTYVHKHLIPRVGNIQLTKLTPMQIQNALNDIASKSGIPTANPRGSAP
jgi:integrase